MKTIRGKIRLILLLISLFTLLLMCIVTVFSIGRIRSDVVSASTNLGLTAGDSSGAALENQILETLTSTAKSKAAIADEKLSKQQNYTQILADFASELYTNPENYVDRIALPPDPTKAGANTAQLLFAEGVSSEEVKNEIGLVANCDDMLLLVPENDVDITANYIATESGFVIMVDPDSDKKPGNIDGRMRSWYIDAKKADKLIWTDVFNDAMGRGLAITCAAPVHDGEGNFKGVVGIGALMTNLNQEIISTTIGETGYTFVVNQDGNIIISPKIIKEADCSFKPENILNSENNAISAMIKDVLNGKASVAQVEYDGKQVYMACEPMDTLPWGIVSVIDVDEALHPVKDVHESITELTNTSIAAIDSSILTSVIAVVAVVVVVLILVFITSWFFSKKLTRPLANLTAGVEKISNGELDTKLDIHTGDEIEKLASSFNSMTQSLQQYIGDLTTVTAEKERIGAELNVATQIQASMLPCLFPAFPDYEEFDIYATMQPAKEVGGDFYDFFLVDETHLGIVIADVSGKGVPAALFMVIAKTLIKNHTQNGESPSQVLTSVNTQLCENNDAAMFVTAWMGVLDIKTGVLIYGNAGHNPPLLKRSKDNGFFYLKSEPGFVLAGLESIQYDQFEITLDKGDILYLYTDGVTEAINAADELFGEERLQQVLNENEKSEMKNLLPAVMVGIDSFVGQADQFDDITMLGLRFKGGSIKPNQVTEIS